jgi:hypothetical protein
VQQGCGNSIECVGIGDEDVDSLFMCLVHQTRYRRVDAVRGLIAVFRRVVQVICAPTQGIVTRSTQCPARYGFPVGDSSGLRP